MRATEFVVAYALLGIAFGAVFLALYISTKSKMASYVAAFVHTAAIVFLWGAYSYGFFVSTGGAILIVLLGIAIIRLLIQKKAGGPKKESVGMVALFFSLLSGIFASDLGAVFTAIPIVLLALLPAMKFQGIWSRYAVASAIYLITVIAVQLMQVKIMASLA